MTLDQVTGPIRSLGPLLVLLLVYYGMDEQTAGLVIAAVLAVIAASWSFYSNRPAALVTEASKTNDVTISVGLGAPEGVQKVMRDPDVRNVVAKPVNGGL